MLKSTYQFEFTNSEKGLMSNSSRMRLEHVKCAQVSDDESRMRLEHFTHAQVSDALFDKWSLSTHRDKMEKVKVRFTKFEFLNYELFTKSEIRIYQVRIC